MLRTSYLGYMIPNIQKTKKQKQNKNKNKCKNLPNLHIWSAAILGFRCRISKGQRYATVYAKDFFNEGGKKYGIRFVSEYFFNNKKNDPLKRAQYTKTKNAPNKYQAWVLLMKMCNISLTYIITPIGYWCLIFISQVQGMTVLWN